MKITKLFLILFLVIGTFTYSKAQDEEAHPGDPEQPHIEFVTILGMQGVLAYPTVSEQIAAFELEFQPALQLIRSVNIAGMTREDAEQAYGNYLSLNPSIASALSLGVNSVGVPYLWRCYEDYIAYKFSNNGMEMLPASWTIYGYSI